MAQIRDGHLIEKPGYVELINDEANSTYIEIPSILVDYSLQNEPDSHVIILLGSRKGMYFILYYLCF